MNCINNADNNILQIDSSNNNIKDSIENKTSEPASNKIKHIVVSGGGVTGFSYYGILRESAKQQLWNI
jgi:NADH dehydrogenase FAD-containing subunit